MHIKPTWRTGLILVGFLLVISLSPTNSAWFHTQPEVSPANKKQLILNRPTFIQAVQAAADFDIGAQLDQEAGIAAWLYTTTPINLTNAASAFRIIEDQTAEYIIGSVDIPNYEEHYDAHVYIHTDGYILAYYLRQDPVSKIINIRERSITSTKLETAIGIVAGAAGVPTTGISHYDFRYPNAENIIMVYEDPDDGVDFTIELPGTYSYFERGFSGQCVNACNLLLDGAALGQTYSYSSVVYGTISASQLAPDVTHTFSVGSSEHLVLLVVYTVH